LNSLLICQKAVNGEFTVKKLITNGGAVKLQPENPLYKTILIQDGMDFEVWGRVISVIHKV